MALHDEVAVVSRRGEGDVGDEARVRRRNADADLPRRLRVDGRLAAARGPEAGAAGHVGALVPGDLGDVAEDGALVRDVVRGAPVRRRRGGVVELRAADADVVRRRSEAADRGAAAGRVVAAVAAGRAAVARGDERGDALRGRLRPEIVVEVVLRRPHRRLALAEAGAHDLGDVVVDDVLRGEVDAVGGRGRLGDDELDGGVLGDGARPLHVEVRFALFAAAEVAGVGAIVDEDGVVGRQAEEAAEILHVAEGDVGAADDGDGLPAAVDAGGVERVDVVDLREVGGGDVVARAAGVVRNRLEAVIHRLPPEVVQRDDAADDVGEPARDRRVLGVGGVELAVDVEFVDLGLEGALDLADAAAEVDPAAPGGDLLDRESASPEPRIDLGEVLIGDAEARPELRRREPQVVLRRARIVKLGEKTVDAVLRAGARLEEEDHPLEFLVRVRRAAVVLRRGQRMDVAVDDDGVVVIDVALVRVRARREEGGSGEKEDQGQDQRP